MANRGDHVNPGNTGVSSELSDIPRYMVIERFHDDAQDNIYQRFEKDGRQLPEGLHYIDSWLSADANICFQLVATQDRDLFDYWIQHWSDLTDFEIYPVDQKPTVNQSS